MELNIVDMYSNILNSYGDYGNLKSIKKRCEWRNIKTNLIRFSLDTTKEINFENFDIILIGSGFMQNQLIILKHLMNFKKELEDYIENDGVILTINRSFQMFGNEVYNIENNQIDSLGIFDIETKDQENGFIGDIILENLLNLKPETIVGFENHLGKIYHKYDALGNVKIGYGNNNEDKKEGMVYKNFIGSNLHGPLLPKNPHLADYLILNALRKKYDIDSLEELEDSFEINAHNSIINRLLKK